MRKLETLQLPKHDFGQLPRLSLTSLIQLPSPVLKRLDHGARNFGLNLAENDVE